MKKDGGPAFPTLRRRDEQYVDETGYGRVRNVAYHEGGASLRDFFAAAVIAGLSADPTVDVKRADVARVAYDMADAMLVARDKP